jgi:hypothetical protein
MWYKKNFIAHCPHLFSNGFLVWQGPAAEQGLSGPVSALPRVQHPGTHSLTLSFNCRRPMHWRHCMFRGVAINSICVRVVCLFFGWFCAAAAVPGRRSQGGPVHRLRRQALRRTLLSLAALPRRWELNPALSPSLSRAGAVWVDMEIDAFENY